MKKQANDSDYAREALIQQRASWAGEVDKLKAKLAWAQKQVRHLDGSLQLFDAQKFPHRTPAKRAQKRVKLYRQGELSGMVLEALRNAGKPIRSLEVTALIINAKGHDAGVRHTLRLRVPGSLGYLARRGSVIKTGYGALALWALEGVPE